jgi:hypothetical protein
MGWWGSNTANSKSERINELVREYTWDNDKNSSEVVTKASVNGGAWTLQKIVVKRTNKVIGQLMFNHMFCDKGQYCVKTVSVGWTGIYNCSKRMVNKWLKLNELTELTKEEKEWYQRWQERQKALELKRGDFVVLGTSNKIKFLYWYNKSKTQLVGINEDNNTFRYNIDRISKIL